jgi:MoaA/NifB/PqqE/SkfB family radical SAM enzyme
MTYIAPRLKVYQHLDRLSWIQDGFRPAPVNVEIDLSNRCSLGCEYCHFAYTHTRGPLAGKRDKPQDAVSGGDLMDTDLAYSILDQLERAAVRSVVWSGGGEPTLHPDFDEIIQHWRGDQGVYTHGGHIDEDRAAIMKDSMTWCYVSLDFADRESYKKYKGVDRFKQACLGVTSLVGAEGNATVGVGFMLTRDNFMDIKKMHCVGKELGADYVQFRPAIRYSHDEPGKADEDTGWALSAAYQLERLNGSPDLEIDVLRFYQYAQWQERGGHSYDVCHWSNISTVITPNGKVWVCCNKREQADSELGDLNDDQFHVIWKRNTAHKVNGNCRIMCRGHLANLELDKILQPMAHKNFI